MPLIIGFTGTQRGMSADQKAGLRAVLIHCLSQNDLEFHHGDCIGSDEESGDIARSLSIPLVIHPPIIESKRAFSNRDGDVVLDPKPYLERDRHIVDVSHFVIGAPYTNVEVRRSGTWYTIRYATRCGRPVTLLPR